MDRLQLRAFGAGFVARSDPYDKAMAYSAKSVVAASYNIHRAVGLDGQRNAARITAVVDMLHADIVALQEVEWGLPAHEAWLERYAQRRTYALIPGPNLEDHRGRFGNVLLTRHPFLSVDRIDLSVAHFEPRAAIVANINLHGVIHCVIATHFGLRGRERRRQSERIAAYLMARDPAPTVLLGDLNEWRRGSRSIRALSDLFDSAPSPRSFPSGRPLFALDRILFRGVEGHPRVHAVRQPLTRIASDHLPVVARFHV